jgi:hypothetical protein
MSGFVVDSRTLVAVRDTLGRLHAQLVGMHTVVWHQHGTLGGAALEAELEHFCGTWHYGVAELGGQLQDLNRRLSEAAAAYDRIEQRITHAGGGAGAAGSGGAAAPGGHGTPSHATPARHHSAAKHHRTTGAHHGVPAAPGGPHYSGGAGLAPASGGASHRSEHKQSGNKHAEGDKHHHSGSGSGVTVIGGSPHHSGNAGHSGSPGHSGSGSGVTVIGGGPSHGGSGTGSGTTTVDEKIHRAEARQRAELAAVERMARAGE